MSKPLSHPCPMNSTDRTLLMQRWTALQTEVFPLFHDETSLLTPKLEKLIHTLELTRIEDFVHSSYEGVGRPALERGWFANAFVAKAVLNLDCTRGLIERLQNDRPLRRICGFSLTKKLPSESTFSRAFAEFAELGLAERVHEALVKTYLGNELIGHISRDATAIEARERPAKKVSQPQPKASEPTRIQRQLSQSLPEALADIPTQCDRGTKKNAQGYKHSWNGYKLHIDTADCGVPIAAILSSASFHDSGAAIPLSQISAQRVTNLYDLMDAGYCSYELQEYSRQLGHVPLIDHNPRRGVKEDFEPGDAERYKIRSTVERTNARLKDEFGGRQVRVQGAKKVYSHLMFGLLVLSADQLMRVLI